MPGRKNFEAKTKLKAHSQRYRGSHMEQKDLQSDKKGRFPMVLADQN
ncbi:50S ribosomal protein L33 [Caenorhabditis elegans]|uniref:50S ribosomal protein L33 n=2 Tax=Caenorhabditis elegans TaxID=6239 RepID=A0A1I6CMC0_CAEEL|nr:50S ribosomal protein L33 [Caenorhabditis elegans]SFQ94307.1 50S ribosomal protein L33 [Caenorhabditis elegans]|eukprot:NP_001334236.1 Uncharacterized protein CELE_F19G12.9 [Caenorhabditis elegans]